MSSASRRNCRSDSRLAWRSSKSRSLRSHIFQEGTVADFFSFRKETKQVLFGRGPWQPSFVALKLERCFHTHFRISVFSFRVGYRTNGLGGPMLPSPMLSQLGPTPPNPCEPPDLGPEPPGWGWLTSHSPAGGGLGEASQPTQGGSRLGQLESPLPRSGNQGPDFCPWLPWSGDRGLDPPPG